MFKVRQEGENRWTLTLHRETWEVDSKRVVRMIVEELDVHTHSLKKLRLLDRLIEEEVYHVKINHCEWKGLDYPALIEKIRLICSFKNKYGLVDTWRSTKHVRNGGYQKVGDQDDQTSV